MTILNEIRNAYNLLDLPEDWDHDGANAVKPKAFNKAMIIIHTLIDRVENLSIPEFNLCRDGSVDIAFRNKTGYELLINVKENGLSYYGDNGNNENCIQETNSENVITWCKQFMTEK